MPEQAEWSAVDDYVAEHLVHQDKALDDAVATATEAGLPAINVSAPQGKLLHLLARACGASSILEIGTLGGYSTIWMARALPPGGRLVTLELQERHAEVARANLAAAGVAGVAEVVVGPALDTLPRLAASGEGPFDLIFIDADKANIPAYFDAAVGMSHPGTLIVVDNVVRAGAVVDPEREEPDVIGIRRLHDLLSDDTRVDATTIQTVGSKGWDGFTLALVGSPA